MVHINFWRCFSYRVNDGGSTIFNGELEDSVEDLADALLYFDNLDLDEHIFALFKDGIEPFEEDSSNRYKLTHGCTDKAKQRKLLIECFGEFEQEDVNGIYVNDRKFSLWLKKPCKIERFQDPLLLKTLTPIENRRGAADLNRDWTLGFFDRMNFKIEDKFENGRGKSISTRYSEDLKRWVENSYCIRQDNPEKAGIMLVTNIIKEREWREHHEENRFVFASIKLDLKKAKKLWSKVAVDIVQALSPKYPSIYLAFGFYENQTLKIGTYLTGKMVDQNNAESNHEKAIDIRRQIKSLINEICDRDVKVRITNAIPSTDSNFTDIKYEYRVFDET